MPKGHIVLDRLTQLISVAAGGVILAGGALGLSALAFDADSDELGWVLLGLGIAVGLAFLVAALEVLSADEPRAG